VYLAAESKEDLYYQGLHREIREWQSECARAIDPRVRADELLGVLLAAGLQYLEQRPLVCDLLRGDATAVLPEWGARFDELRALGRANLVEVLRLGMKQHVFRGDLEVETVASLLQDFHLSAWLALRTRADRDRTSSAAARDELVHRARVGLDLVLNGLRAPSALPA
jgi:hypothetical protein